MEWCKKRDINWIVDADVSGFFDNLDHGHLRGFISQRVNDGGMKRLIGKWLKAGVVDGETLTHPEKGTPQGGVVSPLLANIFLHHVLDDWFVKMSNHGCVDGALWFGMPMTSLSALNTNGKPARLWMSYQNALAVLG